MPVHTGNAFTHRLLTCHRTLLRTRVNNGDSKWRLNREKGQATVMEKAILGQATVMEKAIHLIFGNRCFELIEVDNRSQNKALPRVLAEEDSL